MVGMRSGRSRAGVANGVSARRPWFDGGCTVRSSLRAALSESRSVYRRRQATALAVLLGVVVLIVVAVAAFDAAVPPIPQTVALVVIGATVFAALGVALAGVIRSANGAAPVVNAIYLPMAFLSGSFFSPQAFPEILQRIGDVLPLTYYIEIVRGALLQGEALWADPVDLGVLAAWGVAGMVTAVRSFTWEPRER